MSGAFWAAPQSESDLDHRVAALVSELDQWGAVRFADEYLNAHVREFRAEVYVDAFEGRGVRLVYQESFRATAASWSLHEYQYNYLDPARSRFHGFHHHAIASVAGPDTCLTHAHCKPPDNDRHLRSAWVDAYEAHGTFIGWAAEPSSYPECRSLRLLVPE